MQSSGIKGNIMRRDLEEKFELLLDANDTLLERVVSFWIFTKAVNIYNQSLFQ
jgi:hypothetical protein